MHRVGWAHRRSARAVTVAAVVLGSTACWGDDDDPPETTPTSTTSTTSTTTTSTTTTSTSTTTTTTVPLEEVFVEVTFPTEGHEFVTSSAVFRGETTAGSRVEIGPFATTADVDGEWMLPVTLGPDPGPVAVKVVATDRSGEQAEKVVGIFYKPVERTSTTLEPSF